MFLSWLNLILVKAGLIYPEWVQFTKSLFPIKFNYADLSVGGDRETIYLINLGSTVYVFWYVLPIAPLNNEI